MIDNINQPNVEIFNGTIDVYTDKQITSFVMKTPEECRIVDRVCGFPADMFDIKVM